jgi:hypothetical protein
MKRVAIGLRAVPGTRRGMWAAVAAAVLGLVLLVGSISGGGRYVYCAMDAMSGAAMVERCHQMSPARTHANAVELADCCRVGVLGALPASTFTSLKMRVPNAPVHHEVLPPGAVAATVAALSTAPRSPRIEGPTTGPPRSLGPDRARLMVFLL